MLSFMDVCWPHQSTVGPHGAGGRSASCRALRISHLEAICGEGGGGGGGGEGLSVVDRWAAACHAQIVRTHKVAGHTW
jgi:hypothetical protein